MAELRSPEQGGTLAAELWQFLAVLDEGLELLCFRLAGKESFTNNAPGAKNVLPHAKR